MKQEDFTKVADEEGLYRDNTTTAIINVDHVAYQNHKKTKEFLKKKHLEEAQREARLNNLEKEVASLKDGIGQILDILKHGR